MTGQTLNCSLDPARATALAATLGRPRAFEVGDDLPPLWHSIYFWEAFPPDALGRDGHPETGGIIPETGLPRRMWAAGEFQFHAPLKVGIAAERSTRMEGVTRKSGRTGPLAFVRLRHDIRQRHGLVLTEFQDLVYRSDPQPGDPVPEVPQAPLVADVSEAFTPNSTTLFRYSALTFNGHRIHYDADYARQTEGYDGLIVHGPLIALSLAGLADRQQGPLTSFSFRARSPLICGTAATLCWTPGGVFARSETGALVMEARSK